jgi:hypothetical protein
MDWLLLFILYGYILNLGAFCELATLFAAFKLIILPSAELCYEIRLKLVRPLAEAEPWS